MATSKCWTNSISSNPQSSSLNSKITLLYITESWKRSTNNWIKRVNGRNRNETQVICSQKSPTQLLCCTRKITLRIKKIEVTAPQTYHIQLITTERMQPPCVTYLFLKLNSCSPHRDALGDQIEGLWNPEREMQDFKLTIFNHETPCGIVELLGSFWASLTLVKQSTTGWNSMPV
jgi:hypothetical protein